MEIGFSFALIALPKNRSSSRKTNKSKIIEIESFLSNTQRVMVSKPEIPLGWLPRRAKQFVEHVNRRENG